MDYFVQFQLNFYNIIVLIILYVLIIKRSEVESFSKQLVKATIFFAGAAIIIEPLTWIFDGAQFFGAYFLEYSTNFVLLLMAPIIGAIMLCYVDYSFFQDRNRLKKRFFYLHFLAITLITLIINIFFPIYFEVARDTNIYSSGDYGWIQFILVGAMYVYMLAFVLVNRKRAHRNVRRIFTFFFLWPIIGMIVENFNIHLNFSWNFIVLSLLVVYAFLESTTSERDYLTKIYNRLSYETYVYHLIETHKFFGVVLIDLDKFKEINDKYGHQKGDDVLVDFAMILNRVFAPNKMVSRLAGDEFMIVVEDDIDIETRIKDIYNRMHNSDNKMLKELELSYGFQAYKMNMTIDELYLKVDRKMYKDKNK